MQKITTSNKPIPIKIYQNLRQLCGLSPKEDKAAAIGLKNSIYIVSIKLNRRIIGMGRLIGDGGCFCQIVDICVDPNYQGLGYGKIIMGNIMNYAKEKLPSTCYISLIADGEASFLYEKFGFKDTSPQSIGMYLTLK